jgi:nucleoside-diphosphate-sugar epimerase
MNFLILGGNRFVGKKLATRLVSEGHCVTVLNRSGTGPSGCEIIKHDRNLGFSDPKFNDWNRPPGESPWFDDIIDFCLFKPDQATSLLAKFSPRQKYTFISSAAAYADSHSQLYNEGMSLGGRSAFGEYGREKSLCEDVILERNVNHIVFRPSYIVGNDCPRPRLRYYINSILSEGKAFVPGDGKALFSLVWVDDVVDTIHSFATRVDARSTNRDFNITGHDVYSHIGLVNEISQFLNKKVEIVYESKDTPFLNENFIISPTKLGKRFMPIKYRLEEFCDYTGIKYE